MIRDTCSYELADPPRLLPGICEACAESIFGRRMQITDAIAA